MSKLLIEQKYLDDLISIFDEYCPNATILAYGSRLNGNAHKGSDLDLAVLSNKSFDLSKLKETITQSNIPFLVDILEFNSLPDEFKKEISNNHEIIYPTEKQL